MSDWIERGVEEATAQELDRLNISSVGDLASRWKELTRTLSSTRRIPTDPESRTQALRDLADLKDQDSYKIPEVSESVKGLLNGFKAKAFDSAVPPAAFEQLAQHLYSREQEQNKLAQQALDGYKEALGEEREKRFQQAQELKQRILEERPELSKFGDNDGLMAFLAELAPNFQNDSNDSLPPNTTTQGDPVDEKESAFEAAYEATNNPDFMNTELTAEARHARKTAKEKQVAAMKTIVENEWQEEFEEYQRKRMQGY